MPITFNCPGCGKGYTVPDGVGGKSSKCRACGAAVKIPMASQGGAAAPMAPVASSAPAPARSGGGSGLKKIALVFVALLVVAGLGVVGYGAYALFGGSSSAGMTFMPDNTQVLVSVRVADAKKSGVYDEIKKQYPDIDQKLGEFLKDSPVQLEDVSQVLVGMGDFSKQEIVVAVEFKKSVKLDDIVAYMGKRGGGDPKEMKDSKVGSYTVKGDDKGSLCQINSTLIIGGPPEAVKAVLERDKKPKFSEGMQNALKDADLSQTVSVAINFKELAKNPAVAGTAQQAGVPADSVETAAINVNVSSDVRVSSVSVCKDAKAADEYRKMAEGGIVMAKKFAGDKMPKEVTAILDAVKIAAKDNRLTADVQFKLGPLIPMVQGLMGMQAKQTFSTVGQEIGGPVGKQ